MFNKFQIIVSERKITVTKKEKVLWKTAEPFLFWNGEVVLNSYFHLNICYNKKELKIGIDRTFSCEWCFLHDEYEDGKLRYVDEMRHKTTYSVNSNCFTDKMTSDAVPADKFPTKSPIWSSLIRKICTDVVYLPANLRLNLWFETVLYVKYVRMQ